MGRSGHLDYARYHEVLNRAVWSPRKAARILLALLLQHPGSDGPLIFGIDETLERRRGPHKARIYRDAVRSSRHQLKASGLDVAGPHAIGPCSHRLAPSERYYRQRGRRHKKLTDWARQMILQLRRWLPQRPLVLVGDSGYAVLDLLHCCQSLAHYPHRQIAPGRCPLCASAAPSDRPERSASAERPAAARAEDTPGLPPCQSRCRQPGTTALPARWNTSQTATARASRLCPCAGSWSGTHRANSLPSLALHRSVGGPGADPGGLSCAGNWRSPFRRCGLTWAWRPNASGRTWPLPVLRQS